MARLDVNDFVNIRGVEYRIDGFGPWGTGKGFSKHRIYLVRVSDGEKFYAYGKTVSGNSKVQPGHSIRDIEGR